ncbi:MAG: cyclic nucleotide-binding domain-containing protein [Verrucomicrobia bacterium]|nr:cyclic nucleotide-binding domain-containing protein [Verrucomicrobiota bacterium]
MDSQAIKAVLEQHRFLKDLNPELMELLVGCATPASFKAGSMIFRHKESADNFYVITSGKIAVDLETQDRGTLTLQTLGAGDILGWSWLFPPYIWNFDARCVEDAKAIAFDAKCLRAKCEADNVLGYEMFKRFSLIIVQRLQATRMQLMDIYK